MTAIQNGESALSVRTKINTTFAETKQQADAIRADHDALVEGFTGSLGAAFAEVNDSIVSVQNSVNTSVASLSASLSGFQSTTTSSLTSISADISELSSDVATLEGGVTTLQQQTGTLRTDYDTLVFGFTGDLATAFTAASTALAGAQSTLQSSINGLQDSVDTSIASITADISSLQGTTAANTALITSEISAVNADLTLFLGDLTDVQTDLSAIYDGVTGQVKATALSGYYTQSAVDAAISAEVSALESQILGTTGQVRSTLLTGYYTKAETDTAVSAAVSTLNAEIGSVSASVSDEAIARASADTAEANARQSLATQLRGSYSGTDIAQVQTGLIYSERQARITSDSNLQTQINTLVAASSGDFGELFAAIEEESTARISADAALSGSFSDLTARLDNVLDTSGNPTNKTVEATLSDDRAARVSGDSALSAQVASLSSTVTNNNNTLLAQITSLSTTSANADAALASDISTLDASLAGISANLSTNYYTGVQTDSAISATQTTLAASIASVDQSVQGFQHITDTPDKVTAGSAVTVTAGAFNLGQGGSIIVSESAVTRDTIATTNGAYFEVPVERALLFSGQRVKIGVLARQPNTNAATLFGIVYSTNDAGNSGYMQATEPLTAGWKWFTFYYDVPAANAGGSDYIGIYGDDEQLGRGTTVARVYVEIATVADDLPEIGTLSGQITDILGLDISPTSALATSLTSLETRAGNTEATVTTQGAAISYLENNASAGYLIRAQAGSQVSLLDLVAADGVGGPVSVAKISATNIILDGSVTAASLGVGSVIADKIATNAVTANSVTAGAITADKIASTAVTTAKLNASAVTADKIATNAVTAIKINAGAVEADKLAAGAVTAGKVAANAITADNIAAGAVTAGKLSVGAVTADNIAANTITGNKIAANTITGGLLATSGIITSSAQIQDATVTTLNVAGEAITAARYADVSYESSPLIVVATTLATAHGILGQTINRVAGFTTWVSGTVQYDGGGLTDPQLPLLFFTIFRDGLAIKSFQHGIPFPAPRQSVSFQFLDGNTAGGTSNYVIRTYKIPGNTAPQPRVLQGSLALHQFKR